MRFLVVTRVRSATYRQSTTMSCAWRLAVAHGLFGRWNALRVGQLPTLVIDQDDRSMSVFD